MPVGSPGPLVVCWGYSAPSSSGLGHHPLKVAARVRIPLGLPRKSSSEALCGVPLLVPGPRCEWLANVSLEATMKGYLGRRGESWELRAYVGTDPVTGKQRYAIRSFRGGKREAQRLLAEMVLDAQRGLTVRTTATVGELLEAWFELASTDFSPKTVKGTVMAENRRPPRHLSASRPPALRDHRRSLLTTVQRQRLRESFHHSSHRHAAGSLIARGAARAHTATYTGTSPSPSPNARSGASTQVRSRGAEQLAPSGRSRVLDFCVSSLAESRWMS